MNKLSFKDFLNLNTIAQEVDLSLDTCHKEEVEVNKERINKLFDIAMNDSILVYFDGRYVEEPYDGLEFKTEEEEFYYYNGSSYIVFVDDNNFKVRFKIRYLKDKNYKPEVYKVVEKACIYTKAHPEVSDYKLY
jgi:hypothetical protein